MRWFLIILLLLALLAPSLTPIEQDIVIKASIILTYVTIGPIVRDFIATKVWCREIIDKSGKIILYRSVDWRYLLSPTRVRGSTLKEITSTNPLCERLDRKGKHFKGQSQVPFENSS